MTWSELKKLLELFSQIILDTEGILTRLGHNDVTPVQLAALHFLSLHRNVTLGDLAEGLHISPPAATKLADRLEARGFVKREADPTDRRSLRLRLSQKGYSFWSEFNRAKLESIRRIVEHLRQEDRDGLENGVISYLRESLKHDARARELCLKCGEEHDPECPLNLASIEVTGRPVNP